MTKFQPGNIKRSRLPRDRRVLMFYEHLCLAAEKAIGLSRVSFSEPAPLSDGRSAYRRAFRPECEKCSIGTSRHFVSSDWDAPCEETFGLSPATCRNFEWSAALQKAGSLDQIEVKIQNLLLQAGIRAEASFGGHFGLSLTIKVDPSAKDDFNKQRSALVYQMRRLDAEAKLAALREEFCA